MVPIEKVNLRYAKNIHIKFHEESNNELYFNLRSYPMKAEVKAECNFNKIFKSNIYFNLKREVT